MIPSVQRVCVCVSQRFLELHYIFFYLLAFYFLSSIMRIVMSMLHGASIASFQRSFLPVICTKSSMRRGDNALIFPLYSLSLLKRFEWDGMVMVSNRNSIETMSIRFRRNVFILFGRISQMHSNVNVFAVLSILHSFCNEKNKKKKTRKSSVKMYSGVNWVRIWIENGCHCLTITHGDISFNHNGNFLVTFSHLHNNKLKAAMNQCLPDLVVKM